jgi:hypothetical protein
VNDRTSQKEKNSSTGRMFTMITKENIARVFPQYGERMTQAEFESLKVLANDDYDFSEILERLSGIPDVSEELAQYKVD